MEFDHARLQGFPLTGFNLVDEINALKPKKVLDVGCGQNLFKNKIKNLYGFDPISNPNLDQLCSVQCFDTEPESVDVALCLGSLQYVPRSDQLHQLRRIVSWIKPKGLIVMRSMPFVDYTEHNEKFLLDLKHVYNQRLSWKDFHDWTEICNLAIYRSVALECNKNFPNIQRLSWWWQKNI